MRDVIGLLLIVVAFAKILLAYYLLRSERIKHGAWLAWPLSRGVRLAGSFSSTGALLGVLGLLLMGGTSSLPWWAVALVANTAFWVGALWIDWAQAPVIAESEQCPAPAAEGGFPGDA